MNDIKLGKEISYALRHHPEKYHLNMDEEGWVNIEDLLLVLSDRYGQLSEEDIVALMHRSSKQRYEICNHRIRAFYGHSFDKMIKKDKEEPPVILYHGTAKQCIDSIMKYGLKSMNRQYVHLSSDIETALEVGSRKDKQPVILKIDAFKAYQDGICFYLGNEKVWLSQTIPPSYIHIKQV